MYFCEVSRSDPPTRNENTRFSVREIILLVDAALVLFFTTNSKGTFIFLVLAVLVYKALTQLTT
jgi:hypothetical protein